MTLIFSDKTENKGEQPGTEPRVMFRQEYSAPVSAVSVKFVISVVENVFHG
jgi:hypothetical protein